MAFTVNRHRSEDVARAEDPTVTGAELVALAAHRDTAVKVAVASREDCPMATMLSLAHESDPRVLEALLGNPNAPAGVIEILAQHRRSGVRGLARERMESASQA